MARIIINLLIVAAAVACLTPLSTIEAAQPPDRDRQVGDIPDHWSYSQVSAWLKSSNAVAELSDASIIIEVNSTDGDAGFQVFFDGDGWKHAYVYDSNGRKIVNVMATGGVRNIGGGTELFMETSEPEYDGETLEGLEELIDLLPEGEYFFIARTMDNRWATGTAELTHDVPAGPEILEPAPVEDGCSDEVYFDSAVIRWAPVEMDIWNEDEIEVEAYQVIVEAEEDPEREFTAIVPADTHQVMVPPEVLAGGGEFKFEVLAIEESGNQTITEGCFEAQE